MRINKFNNEGYLDPTAYHTLEKIEKEERATQKATNFHPLVYICSPYSGDTDGNLKKGMANEIRIAEKRSIPVRYFTEDCEEVNHA